ncbi:MAG: hypothetical protein ACPLPR_06625 [Bacillota bacterium]
MKCPNCGGRAVGKVGSHQFYCWECCVEFSLSKDGHRWLVYVVQDDGTLTKVVNDASTARPSPAPSQTVVLT